jgi:hypothetical protein
MGDGRKRIKQSAIPILSSDRNPRNIIPKLYSTMQSCSAVLRTPKDPLAVDLHFTTEELACGEEVGRRLRACLPPHVLSDELNADTLPGVVHPTASTRCAGRASAA